MVERADSRRFGVAQKVEGGVDCLFAEARRAGVVEGVGQQKSALVERAREVFESLCDFGRRGVEFRLREKVLLEGGFVG